MQFRTQQLYGGAMTVNVPENYYDVSDVRQVPDTQEVFQEREGMHNLIFDILEHVEHIKNPLEAARYHLEDYVDGDGDLRIWNVEAVKPSHLKTESSAATLLATTPAKDGKCTAIFLLLIRLEKHATDLLITANLHNVTTGSATESDGLFQESTNADLKSGKEIFQNVIDSFEIKDFGLFHPNDS